MKSLLFLILLCLMTSLPIRAQESQNRVLWSNFGDLDDSLQQQIKPVILYFSTEWCVYCRKMDRRVFTKKEVAEILNDQYYAVKMDAETRDTIYFEGQTFVNQSANEERSGIHEIAMIFSRKAEGFVAPTFIVLDDDFRVRQRYYEYLPPKRLISILKEFI